MRCRVLPWRVHKRVSRVTEGVNLWKWWIYVDTVCAIYDSTFFESILQLQIRTKLTKVSLTISSEAAGRNRGMQRL